MSWRADMADAKECIGNAVAWLRTARNFKKLPGNVEVLWRLGRADAELSEAKRLIAQVEKEIGQ